MNIERAIAQLPNNEITQLVAWLDDYSHQIRDKQIENDLDAGRIDSVIAEQKKNMKCTLHNREN
jgi:hypothetical protein